MRKIKTNYKLIGFYKNFNGSGKLRLILANPDIIICCYIEDIKVISKYISEEDRNYIEQLAK